VTEEGAPFDSGFDDTGPFRVSPASGSVSLEAALRDFGPAAIDDLIPRLGELAATLDRAHALGAVHGALHPRNIFVTDLATDIVADGTPASPYAAPEVLDGRPATPASDEYSLAAIAHQWMTGRTIAGPADRPVDVRAIPGVDRAAMAQAFTRALARSPDKRFASCTAFCGALAAAAPSTLPLLADDHDPVEPFVPETPVETADLAIAPSAAPPIDLRDLDIAEPAGIARAEPDVAPVPAWQPASTASRDSLSQRFSGLALIIATLVGAVFGFAAGYMARPRALQTAPIAEGLAPEAGATGSAGATKKGAPDAAVGTAAPAAPAPRAAPDAPAAPVSPGRLLVRSTPSGATVSVDGTPRGQTPLTLRDLPLGTREVVVSASGYVPESQRVALTDARPSRSIEVRLSRVASTAAGRPAPPRPSTPATLGRPAESTGSLVVESRPSGAAVAINGQPRGATPLNVADLPPGDYTVTMTMKGYRDFATTVRVVAGERARAAARLTEQEQE
jgi:hypothetical protein